MKRFAIAFVLFLGALVGLVMAQAADVEPAEVQVAFRRGDAPTITGTYFQNTALRMSFQAFSDSSGTVTQDLTAVTMELRVGTASTNVPYIPTATNAAAGRAYADVQVPGTNVSGSIRVQLKLTGTNDGGTVYIYPQGFLSRMAPLE